MISIMRLEARKLSQDSNRRHLQPLLLGVLPSAMSSSRWQFMTPWKLLVLSHLHTPGLHLLSLSLAVVVAAAAAAILVVVS